MTSLANQENEIQRVLCRIEWNSRLVAWLAEVHVALTGETPARLFKYGGLLRHAASALAAKGAKQRARTDTQADKIKQTKKMVTMFWQRKYERSDEQRKMKLFTFDSNK